MMIGLFDPEARNVRKMPSKYAQLYRRRTRRNSNNSLVFSDVVSNVNA